MFVVAFTESKLISRNEKRMGKYGFFMYKKYLNFKEVQICNFSAISNFVI